MTENEDNKISSSDEIKKIDDVTKAVVETEEPDSGEVTEAVVETEGPDSGEVTEAVVETEGPDSGEVTEAVIEAEVTDSGDVAAAVVEAGETDSGEVTEAVVETEEPDSGDVTEAVVETEEPDSGEVTEAVVETEEADSGDMTEAVVETEEPDSGEVTEAVVEAEVTDSDEVTEAVIEAEVTDSDEVTEAAVEAEVTDSDEVTEAAVEAEVTDSDEVTEAAVEAEVTDSDDTTDVVVDTVTGQSADGLTDVISESPVTGTRSDSKSKPKEHIVAILIRGFISFVGAVMLFLLLSMVVVKQTLINPNFMIKVGSDSGYFASVAKDSSRSIQDLGLGSGIPEGVLTEVVSEDTVKKDFSEYIKDAYEGKTQTLDSTEFVQHVSEVIDKYSQENDLPQTDESKASVAEFAEHAFTERYVPSIQLKYWPIFASRLTAYSKTLEYIIVVLLGVSVLMIILLMLTTRKVGYRRYSYFSYLFLSAGLMTLAGPIYILFKKIIERINIDSESLYKFMTTYLKDIVMYFVYAGVVLMVIGVIFVIISSVLESKQNRLTSD